MKKTILILMSLISIFFITWSLKIRAAINQPDNILVDYETPWYESRYSSPIASDEWILDPEIPENYVPVPGEEEMYMVVNNSGEIINYRQRTKQIDGSWVWEDIKNPNLAIEIAPVKGKENLYKITDDEKVVSYQKYVRNPDNTFAFVETDKDGNALDNGANAEEITDNYIHYQDDIYALYNENNVLIGFRQRVQDANGQYYWYEAAAPTIQGTGLISLEDISNEGDKNIGGIGYEKSSIPVPSATNDDGSYTVTKRSTNTVTENGYSVIYETTVYYTYDKDGNLLSTSKEGPNEVSRTSVGTGTITPNRNLIASTLDGEVSRVSANVSFNTAKASEVLSLLNAERINQGHSVLTMNTESESYKLACIKAADMATYGYCATESPMYGTLDDLIGRYGCSSTNPSENIWKAGDKSASEIHSRLQSNDNSRMIRMSDYTEVGIAVLDVNGNTYYAEVFLQ